MDILFFFFIEALKSKLIVYDTFFSLGLDCHIPWIIRGMGSFND